MMVVISFYESHSVFFSKWMTECLWVTICMCEYECRHKPRVWVVRLIPQNSLNLKSQAETYEKILHIFTWLFAWEHRYLRINIELFTYCCYSVTTYLHDVMFTLYVLYILGLSLKTKRFRLNKKICRLNLFDQSQMERKKKTLPYHSKAIICSLFLFLCNLITSKNIF